MEENQLSQAVESMPLTDDNTDSAKEQQPEKKQEDKLQDPSSLILGKFKSAEDLAEGYKQLEKLQGNQSSELGMLRERVASIDKTDEVLNLFKNVYENRAIIQESVKKYPEYFADPSFKQLYTEGYKAFGADLDVDKLVNLIEGVRKSIQQMSPKELDEMLEKLI